MNISCIQNLDSPQHRIAMGRHVSDWQIGRLERCVNAAESEKVKP